MVADPGRERDGAGRTQPAVSRRHGGAGQLAWHAGRHPLGIHPGADRSPGGKLRARDLRSDDRSSRRRYGCAARRSVLASAPHRREERDMAKEPGPGATGENGTPEGTGTEGPSLALPLTITHQYVKDLSFENPAAPSVFIDRQGAPNVGIEENGRAHV